MNDATAGLVFQAKALGLPTPVLELRFHPTRRWRFDLAWPAQRVAVEVDGGVFSGGRHARGAGIRGDCEKFSEAAAMGWRVLRVLPEHINDGRALGWLERALAYGRRPWTDSPDER